MDRTNLITPTTEHPRTKSPKTEPITASNNSLRNQPKQTTTSSSITHIVKHVQETQLLTRSDHTLRTTRIPIMNNTSSPSLRGQTPPPIRNTKPQPSTSLSRTNTNSIYTQDLNLLLANAMRKDEATRFLME
ncbi:hypothetical protein Droror1_Dr00002564 [Drosera rotundifolia]